MKSVLIISHQYDSFFYYVKEQAEKNNFNCLKISANDLVKRLKQLSADDHSCISFRIGKKITGDDIAAVFPRTNMLSFNGKNFSCSDRQYIETECNALYRGWLSSLKIPVINNLPPQYWNREILYPYDFNQFNQFKSFLKDRSISVPPFTITNCVKDIKDFFYANERNILYSPLSRYHSPYKISTEDNLSKLFLLTEYFPITITPVISGKVCYVYFASGKSFIRFEDKRKSGSLPAGILNECRLIAKSLHLEFLSFKFILNKKGCFLTSISLNPDLSNCSSKIARDIIKELFRRIPA